jgi:acyl-CoA synthetase (AMP-forming)/AMP-acid ligase II
MGLIGGILHPLQLGFPMTLMSPFDFLKRPVRWVRAMSKYGATMSVAPNFAFALVARKVTAEDIASLDLSKLRALWNGAEPIRHDVLRQFAETFAPCGLNPRVFIPCYGLAESSLLVSGVRWNEEPQVTFFSRRSVNAGAPEVVAADDEDAVAIVGCGRPAPDADVRIVDPDGGTELEAPRIGEVWVSGPSIGRGYYGRPDASKQTFEATLPDGTGPFLRTGDLGFIWNGELHIAGRSKDLIIVRGQNHHPAEIERTAEESHGALRRGCSAAFAIDLDGEERVAIVCELERRYIPDRRKGDSARPPRSDRRQDTDDRRQQAPAPGIDAPSPGPLDPKDVVTAIRQAVAQTHEVQVAVVCLVPPGSSFKTPSGKIQRKACRDAWLEGQLTVLHESRLG